MSFKKIEKEILENYQLKITIDNCQYFSPQFRGGYVGNGVTEQEALKNCIEDIVISRDDLSDKFYTRFENKIIQENNLTDESLTEHPDYIDYFKDNEEPEIYIYCQLSIPSND